MSKPLLVRRLTSVERKELVGLIRESRDARVVRRAQVIRLSSQGKTATEIGALWSVSGQLVRKIINRFHREGIAGLANRPRQGRPRKTNARYVQLLKQAVSVSPRKLGYSFTCWTLDRLREHLARKTRIVLSAVHLSRLMAEHQIVYRRPKHGMAHLRDPNEYDEKKAFLHFLKKRPCDPQPPSTCSTSMSVRFTSTRP
jgi:transposase